MNPLVEARNGLSLVMGPFVSGLSDRESNHECSNAASLLEEEESSSSTRSPEVKSENFDPKYGT